MVLTYAAPYADELPLEAAHLDEVARWPFETTQGLLGAALGFGGEAWGILHADEIKPGAGESVASELDGIAWARWIFLLPRGVMVLPPGRRSTERQESLSLAPPKPYVVGAETTLESLAAQGPGRPPLFVLGGGRIACGWPVGYLGATASLRVSLAALHEAIAGTLKSLKNENDAYSPWLHAALNLGPSSPTLVALPVLGALAGRPLITKGHWPLHDGLVEDLRSLATKIRGWRTVDDPELKFLGEAPLLAGRSGQIYQKRSDVSLTTLGFSNDRGPQFNPQTWGVAERVGGCEMGLRPVAEVPATWGEFVVRFPRTFEPGPLSFTLTPGGKQWSA